MQKAYMRKNGWQWFVRDDWRVLPDLTLLGGLEYNYFSPFAEKYDRLSTLDYVPGGGLPGPVQPYGIGPASGANIPVRSWILSVIISPHCRTCFPGG